MNLFRSFLAYLNESADSRREARISNYLSQASDLLELEYRIRELEQGGGKHASSWMSVQG